MDKIPISNINPYKPADIVESVGFWKRLAKAWRRSYRHFREGMRADGVVWWQELQAWASLLFVLAISTAIFGALVFDYLKILFFTIERILTA